MLAASFDVNEKSAAGDACLKALALWRPSVISGQIAGGETPVIGLPEKLRDNANRPSHSAEETSRSTPDAALDEVIGRRYQSLIPNQATAKENFVP